MTIALSVCPRTHAQWELLKESASTFTVYVTKNGNILFADFLRDGTGGIYCSEDAGSTWVKADVPDYEYSKFIEAGDFLFAVGADGYVARSEDDGKTWTLTNYVEALKDIELPNTICYAAEYHKGKLYVGDFNGGGILYSEDFGDTWLQTDRESLMISFEDNGENNGKDSRWVENIYNLVSFNGELYAFGVYLVFRYDETENKWDAIRNDGNFMAQSTVFNGKLYCGRSVMSYGDHIPFLECTTDGITWDEVRRPEGVLDNNVRTLASDGNNIYVGLQTNGLYYTGNDGEEWFDISEGVPYLYEDRRTDERLSPLKIIPTDDYLYLAVYDAPASMRNVSGIYRMAKSDLPASVEVTSANDRYNVYTDGSCLYVRTNENVTVSITDVCGKKVIADSKGVRVDLSSLNPGIYIYEIRGGGNTVVTDKFVKR